MATLEVHDGRGRVEIVTISQDHTALFGSDPKCDVVINDPQVLPFHGRLRYKGGKYRAEAFPEANALSINGKKVVAASLAQGDEIKVGAYKIFLVNAEDGPTDMDKTREQAPPTSRQKAVKGGATATAKPPVATVTSAAATATAIKPPTPPKPPGPIKKFVNILLAKDQRPGEEKIIGSPLVLALAVALAVLVVSGIGLYSVIARTNADNLYNTAMENYSEKQYVDALKGFEKFLESNPRDTRAGKARVKLALSTVHQHASMGTPNWTAALESATKAYANIGNEKELDSKDEEAPKEGKKEGEAFEDDRLNFASLVLKTAEGLADRAKAAADRNMLGDVNKAIELHNKIAGEGAIKLRDRSQFPSKFAAANAAIVKAETRTKKLAEMDKALKAGSATDAYTIRDSLVALYPDFATDKDIIEKLKAANELIKNAVTFDAATRAAEHQPHPEPLGPPLSLVLVTNPQAKPGTSGPIVYAIAQGLLYALDGTNGAPIWQAPVGLTSPFAPIAIAGQTPSALAYDSRHGELVRYEGRTGKLLWRQTTGETITDPPLVLGNRAFQLTPSGKMLSIDLTTGDLKGTLNIGRGVSKTPAADESGEFLFVAGDRDVLYVFSRDPMKCVGVEYLGQPIGSIACAPARIGPYLIVAENDTLLDGKWTIWTINQADAQLRKVQEVAINGWTWTPPVSQEKYVWSVSDRGALTVFEVGDPTAKQALTQIATTPPDARPSGPAYAISPNQTQLWLSSNRAGRFLLDPTSSTITPDWVDEGAGTALAPIQKAGNLTVFTQRYLDRPGVSVTARNFLEKKVVWQTALGTAWPLEPTQTPGSDGLSVLVADGKLLAVSKELVALGSFIPMPLPRAGYFYVPSTKVQRLDSNGLTIIITAPDADHFYVRKADGSSEFQRIDLPAPIGATPLFWGEDLFTPGLDGRVYLIDPKTGAAKAEPYVPPFERTKPTKWKNPVKLGDDAVILADESGRVRRLSKVTMPRLRLAVTGEVVDLKSAILADPAITQEAVIIATVDGKVRALSGRDLSPLGAWNLTAPRALGPYTLSGNAVIIDAAGNVLAFGPDGQKMWGVDLDDPPPLGPPILKDDALIFLSREGALQKRSIRDGSKIDRVVLGVLPTSGLISDGPDLLVPSAPGTYRTLQTGDKAAQP